MRGGLGPAAMSITDQVDGGRTYWNGEPAVARKVRLRVDAPPAGQFPRYWAKDLVGMEVDAVRVEYGGAVFYLDDSDGGGWRKVTEGRGGPSWPSFSLFGTEVGQ